MCLYAKNYIDTHYTDRDHDGCGMSGNVIEIRDYAPHSIFDHYHLEAGVARQLREDDTPHIVRSSTGSGRWSLGSENFGISDACSKEKQLTPGRPILAKPRAGGSRKERQPEGKLGFHIGISTKHYG